MSGTAILDGDIGSLVGALYDSGDGGDNLEVLTPFDGRVSVS